VTSAWYDEPTMSAPRRGKITSSLEQWSLTAGEGEERTVIIRPGFSADIEEAAAELGRLGAQVQSAGPGAITAAVSPSSLTRLADLSWVQAVEEPRVRFPLKG
jgi:hypothetical protein